MRSSGELKFLFNEAAQTIAVQALNTRPFEVGRFCKQFASGKLKQKVRVFSSDRQERNNAGLRIECSLNLVNLLDRKGSEPELKHFGLQRVTRCESER